MCFDYFVDTVMVMAGGGVDICQAAAGRWVSLKMIRSLFFPVAESV